MDFSNFDFDAMRKAAEEVEKQYEPISKGFHDFQVTSFMFKLSKSGNPMFEAEFTVDNGQDVGKSLKSWLVMAGDGAKYSQAKLFWLFKAAGIKPIGGAGDKFAAQFKPLIQQGKFRFNAKVIQKEQEKYNGNGEKEIVAEIVFTRETISPAKEKAVSVFSLANERPQMHQTTKLTNFPENWDQPTYPDDEFPF